MSRTARFTEPDAVHHVISRFVDHGWYLRSHDEREMYLHLLGRALEKTDWRCLAYCLMSNHLHFAMVAGEAALDSWARKVNSPFARWLNTTHDRLGPVFADRPSRLGIEVSELQRRHSRGAASIGKRVAVHSAARLRLHGSDIAAALGFTRQRSSTIRQKQLAAHERALVDAVVKELEG